MSLNLSLVWIVGLFCYARSVRYSTVGDEEMQRIEEFISTINLNTNASWTAGNNHRFRTEADVRRVIGVLRSPTPVLTNLMIHSTTASHIPSSFDARQQWPHCPTIAEIKDQGSCGSCWAAAATSAISDRICIHSGGAQKVRISTEDLLSCCDTCGDGCNGGDPQSAWIYYQTTGIVTGGPYMSKSGCRPYSIPPCEHHTTGTRPSCKGNMKTPPCVRKCQDERIDYYKDKHFGRSGYRIVANSVMIQLEIMKNGPVEADFRVFADFPYYKKGVYKYLRGRSIGAHAVKLIGWGVESGLPYWLAVNSWNTDWGDQGFFKILRGINECGIEENVLGGLPRL